MNKLNIGETSPPRFEFRTFGHDFNKYQKLMKELTQPVPEDLQIRVFNDIYIISKNVDSINIKIKNNLLDIKKLILVDNSLEQWNSTAKYEFPLEKQTLFTEILPELKADIPVLKDKIFDAKRLLNIAKLHKDLIPVSVHKKRYAYLINYTICEIAEVIINKEYLSSVAVESTNKTEVINTVNQLKLNEFNNINYVKVIKLIEGLIDIPLAN